MLGTALVVLGIAVWASALTLRLTPRGRSDTSMAHVEGRSIGVIAGGALVASGVILLAIAV